MAAKKAKTCRICKASFQGRKDAKTCSSACRKRLQRSLQAQVAQKAKRLESTLGREFHRIAASLLPEYVAHEPMVLADERGGVPVSVLEPPQAEEVANGPQDGAELSEQLAAASERRTEDSQSSASSPLAVSSLAEHPDPVIPDPGTAITPATSAELPPEPDAAPLETVPAAMDAAETLTAPAAVHLEDTMSTESLEPSAFGNAEAMEPVDSSEPPAAPRAREHFLPFHYNKLAFMVTGLALLLITVAGGGSLFLAARHNAQLAKNNIHGPSSFAVTNVPLSGVKASQQLQVGQSNQLAINGQLQVNDSLVIAPTAAPSSPVTGQIYFDQTAKAPFYYNGSQFISLAPQQHVTSLGGSSGVIGLGNGLSVVNNQLDVSSAITQQINNAANSGVLSLAGTANQVNVSSATGNVTLSLPQSIAVTSTPTFGGLTVSNLGVGLVQSSASGVLSSGVVDRNNGSYLSGTLSVANGGTGAGSFTSNGILYGNGTGALQATASAANSVLVTSAGSVPSLSQTLPIAVQQNITNTGALINGSINNGFGAIATLNNISTTAKIQAGTLEVDGGSFTVDNSGNFVAAGTGAVQGAGGLTLGVAGTTTGSLILANSGSSTHVTTLQGAAPSQNQTITIPDANASSDVVCLVGLGNCAGSGGGVVGTGTPGTVALFNGAHSITDSILTQSGTTTLTDSGNLIVQGSNSLTLGTASGNTGAISFKNAANSNSLTLQSGTTTGNLTFTLPTADGTNGQCLKTNGSAAWGFADCTGGAGGGVTSLNGLTGVISLANATGVGSTVTINNAKADASTEGIATFNATNFTDNGFGVINTVQNIATTSSPQFTALSLSYSSTNSALSVVQTGTSEPAAGKALILANNNTTTPSGNLLDLQNKGTSELHVDVSGNLTTLGNITLGSLGTADTSTLLCRDSVSIISACTGSGSGAPFVQGGNSFGATAVLGTNDSNGLNIRTNGNTQVSIGTNGATTFQNSADSTTAFQIQNHAGTSNLLVADTTDSRIGLGTTPITTAGSGLLQVGAASSTTADQGISFGGSTTANLYRSATSTLKTDGNLVTGGTLTVGTLGTTNTSTLLCYNSSNIIAGCNSTGSGAPFVQGGNSFGATAVLGTNDSNGLNIRTNGNTQVSIGTNGATTFQNSADSTTAFQIQNHAGTSNLLVADTTDTKIGVATAPSAGGSTLQVGGTISLTTLGSATSASYLCYNSSNQLASCTTGTGAAFIQGGNSFGAQAVLGTNDSNSLAIRTGGTNRLVVDTSGNLTFQQASTISTGTNGVLTIQGGNASGTNATGSVLNINGGQGTGNAVGGNIVFQYAPKGTTGSSLNALQTACQISGTDGTFSCPGSGTSSEQFGSGAAATGNQGVAVGNGASAAGASSTVIGQNASASSGGSSTVVIGHSASSTGASAIVIGPNATNSSLGAVTIGASASGSQYSVALGYSVATSANRSIAIGYSSAAASVGSIALGAEATTTASNQIVIGGTTSSGAAADNITQAIIGDGVTSATPVGFTLQGTSGSGSNITGATVAIAGGQGTGTGNGGSLNFQIAKAGSTGSSLNSLATVFSLSGSNGGAALFENSANSTTAFQIQNQAGTSNLLVADTTNSRIGLGTTPITTSGSGLLQVGAASSTTAAQGISFGGDTSANLYRSAAGVTRTDGDLYIANSSGATGLTIDSTGNPTADISFKVGGTQIAKIVTNGSQTFYDGLGTGDTFLRSSNSLQFRTGGISNATSFTLSGTDGSALFQNMTNGATAFQVQNATNTAALIVSTNNVTTGWNAANATLDVAKDSGTSRSINAAGTVNASGLDYAEYIPWSGSVPDPGSIVTYEGSAYVVSSQQTASFVGGDVFGDSNQENIMVAFAGQVPTKVTGPVNVGDLLVDNGDGTARAVDPATASLADYLGKIGIAQESSSDPGVKLIQAAVGTTSANVASSIQQSNSFTDLNVSGTATINNLTVTGTATLAALHVTGSAQFDSDITVGGHIITAGGQPTSQPQVAAGGSASVAVDGTDTTGTISITTGSDPTAGELAKILFSKTYGKAPHIVLSPSNGAASGLHFYKGATSATDFMFDAQDPPAANTTYTFDYFIAQ